MKCPLTIPFTLMSGTTPETPGCDCLGQDCEWWLEEIKACSVRVVAGNLCGIVTVLDQLQEELCLNKYQYRCHECGTFIEIKASGGSRTPSGWTRKEQVDGKHTWSCEKCSVPGESLEEEVKRAKFEWEEPGGKP